VPVAGRERRSEDLERLTEHAVLSRGLGRAYGDAALPPPSDPVVAGSVLADRILSFDPERGVLRAEAGFSVRALNRLFLPRGWFTPITSGTQDITLGGAVASDVHGKNHHCDGSFGAHLLALRMRTGNGRIVECGPDREPDLFRATIGGMGLTGHILEVESRLARVPSPWILMEEERIDDIDQFVDRLKETSASWPHTMGWIDCLTRGRHIGRGILMRGRWATPDEVRDKRFPAPLRSPGVPFELPGFVISRFTVRAFNSLFYHSHLRRVRRTIAHPEKFFYPLDAIADWNRLYGRRGFTQYQCVLPNEAGRGAARRFLEVLTARGGASMLCVIKDCGPEGIGMLSFPRPGISIALDIPMRANTQALVDALNVCVLAEGGRIYLTKDQLTRPEHFRQMEPRLDDWQRVRRCWDPEGRLRSALSVRLLGDRP
jgi:FAD/FMN-containing dehydrogenase